jgi:integrase
VKPRDRKSAQGLLLRMEARLWKDGKTVSSYRYHPVGGKPIALGTDKQAAIQKVLDLSGNASDAGTVKELWRLYTAGPGWPVLSDATRADYLQCSVQVLKTFGDARAALIRPTDINRYLRVERADAPVRANREAALLSNLFNLGIERGDLDANPCKQVRRNKEQPRTEAPETAVLGAFVDWLVSAGGQRRTVAQMAEFAAYSGSRRTEFLRLTWAQIDRPGGVIRVKRAKQRGQVVWEKIAIGPQMGELLDRIEAARTEDEAKRKKKRPRSEYVFCNKQNNPYRSNGFMANWGKWMAEAVKAGIVSKRFTFHDLRAYYVTLHRDERGSLPDLHKNPATTARIYDRRKESKRGAM